MNSLVKERLTGAIILVALIVVLVPELLTGPIRPGARARGPAPSAEEPPLRSYTIDLADEAHGGGTLQPQPSSSASPARPAAEPIPAPLAGAASAAVAAGQTSPAHAQTPVPAVTPAAASPAPLAPAVATAAAASATGWVVQLGSFASRANAERLAQQVRALGYQVGVSRGTTGRRLYRVQVGAAHDHAAAEQILSKLRAQGHNGSVVPR